MASENKTCHNNCYTITAIVLIIGLIALNVAQFFLLPSLIEKSLLNHEYSKVGGKDAYETVTELQAVYLKHPENQNNIQAQKEILKQLKESAGETITTDTTNSDSKKLPTLTKEKMDSILENAVVEGNLETAEVVMVEYSDMECPFCVRQQNENQIAQNLVAEFGDKVAIIFKNHRGVNHKWTEVKALGLLCAGKLGGNEAYTKFYKEIFAYSAENGDYYPVGDLAKLVEKIGVDVATWQSCVDNKETLAQFNAETSEATSFNLNGTPGSLLFNKNTGAYTTVEGAYPYARFQTAVNSLIAQ